MTSSSFLDICIRNYIVFIFFVSYFRLVFFFFFSSRRRHTRCLSDWSSDVCSSDLDKLEKMLERAGDDGGGVLVVVDGVFSMEGDVADLPRIVELCKAHGARLRSEERRVGKECRSGRAPGR